MNAFFNRNESLTAAIVCLAFFPMTGCRDRAGGVEIWKAVDQQDVAAISRYAEAGGNLNVKNSSGSTPLWLSLEQKKRESYESLLENGADPNIIMSGRRVVTHWAARESDSRWLKLALDHGADPNLVNTGSGRPSEGTPLDFAIATGDVINELVENVQLLIEHGADVNKSNRYGTYPLALAAAQNDFKTVLLLLDAGAEFRLAKASGNSFLFTMAQKLKFREQEKFLFRLEEPRKDFDAVTKWLTENGVEIGDEEL